jgi:hypothetical protein
MSEKIDLGTTEIARRIRQQLKKEFPRCKFSVTSKYYSMGSSISINWMTWNTDPILPFEKIPEIAFLHLENHNYTKDQIKEMQQGEKYHQLNPYTLREEYKSDYWCNGVFLTEKAHRILQRVMAIVDQYNFDKSDSSTDYYFVNFSLNISIGKWDKPFQVVIA